MFIFQLPAMTVLRYFLFIYKVSLLYVHRSHISGMGSMRIYKVINIGGWISGKRVRAGGHSALTVKSVRKNYLSSRQAMPGASSQSPPTPFPLFAKTPSAPLLLLSPRQTLRGLPRGPRELPGEKVFTYLPGRQCRAAPGLPGIPEKRRRRWRCG